MRVRIFFLIACLAWAQWPPHIWQTEGFEALRQGEFEGGGTNLYVSRRGAVQTVHRWDVNNDGYFDLIFNNTHDLVYTPPANEYRFGNARRSSPARIDYPGAASVRVLASDLNDDGFPELIIPAASTTPRTC
jgi:hypothetical protein